MVTCTDCGDVVVPGRRCQLRRCDDDGSHSLAYRCPDCGRRDVVPNLQPQEISELVDAGLDVIAWRLPAELVETRSCAPALVADDLLDFHLMLEGDGWWHQVLGGRPS
jgi:hypothetical protein